MNLGDVGSVAEGKTWTDYHLSANMGLFFNEVLTAKAGGPTSFMPRDATASQKRLNFEVCRGARVHVGKKAFAPEGNLDRDKVAALLRQGKQCLRERLRLGNLAIGMPVLVDPSPFGRLREDGRRLDVLSSSVMLLSARASVSGVRRFRAACPGCARAEPPIKSSWRLAQVTEKASEGLRPALGGLWGC